MDKSQLEELRLKIDEVDEKMIYLLQERMEIASQIGLLKKRFDLPVIDLDRKKIALAKRLELARKVGLPEAEAVELFELLHSMAVKIQEDIKEA